MLLRTQSHKIMRIRKWHGREKLSDFPHLKAVLIRANSPCVARKTDCESEEKNGTPSHDRQNGIKCWRVCV